MTGDPLDEWPSSQQLVELFPAAYAPRVDHRVGPWVKGVQNTGGKSHKLDKPLNTRARMILSLEIRGHNKKQIAEQLGMSAMRISQITATDRYLAAREVLLGRMDAEFSIMKPAVFRALSQGLNSRDENTALRASETWMKAAGFGQYGKGNTQQGLTAEDVARQLLQVSVNVNVNKSD